MPFNTRTELQTLVPHVAFLQLSSPSLTTVMADCADRVPPTLVGTSLAATPPALLDPTDGLALAARVRRISSRAPPRGRGRRRPGPHAGRSHRAAHLPPPEANGDLRATPVLQLTFLCRRPRPTPRSQTVVGLAGPSKPLQPRRAKLLGASPGTLYNHTPDLRQLRASATSSGADQHQLASESHPAN